MPKRKSNRGGRGGGAVMRQGKSDSGKEKGSFVESEENEEENGDSMQMKREKSVNQMELSCDTDVGEDGTDQNALRNIEGKEMAKKSTADTEADFEHSENHDPENFIAPAIVSPLLNQSVKGNTMDSINDVVKESEVNADIIIKDNQEQGEEESMVEDAVPDISNRKEIMDVIQKNVSKKDLNADATVNKEDVALKDTHDKAEWDEIVSNESSVIEAEVIEENASDISLLKQVSSSADKKTVKGVTLETVNVQEDNAEDKLISCVNTPCTEVDALETVNDNFQDETMETEKTFCIEYSLEAVSVQGEHIEDEFMEAEKTAGIEGDALEAVSVQDDNFEDEPIEAGKTTCLEGDALEAVSVQEENFEDDFIEAGKAICMEGDALEAVSVQDNLEDELFEAEDAKQDSEDEEIQYVDEEADEEQNLLDVISGGQKKKNSHVEMSYDKSEQNLDNNKFEEISEGSINQAEQEEVLNESFSDVEILGETFAMQEKKTLERSEKQAQNKEAESLEEVFFATENDHSKVTAEDKDNDDISDASLSDHDNANMSLEEISDDDVDVSKKKKPVELSSKNERDEKSKHVSKSNLTSHVEDSKCGLGTAHNGAGDEITEAKDIGNQGSKKTSPSKETNLNVNPSDKERSSQVKPKDMESDSCSIKGTTHQKEENNRHTSKSHDRNVLKVSRSESHRGCSDLSQRKVMANSASQTAPHQMKGKIVQCTINPIKSVLMETDLINESKTTSKFLDQFREKLPFSIIEDIIAKITSPQSIQESFYSLSLGPITFADMDSTEFRENLLKQPDKFSIAFDEHHHGIYRALFKNQDNVASFVRQLKNLKVGNRYMTISLSYGVEKISNGVVNLMYDQDIQSKKQQSIKGDAKLRAKVQLSGVPDGISKDFVHLLFPEALTITSGPLFDNKRSLLLGFSSTTLAQEVLLCHDLVVVNGHQVSMSASDYVDCSATDSHSYNKDGSVVIDVASESSEEVPEIAQAHTDSMIVDDSATTLNSVTEPVIKEGGREKSPNYCNEEKSYVAIKVQVNEKDISLVAEPMETHENDTISSNTEMDKDHDPQQTFQMSVAVPEKHDAQQDKASDLEAGEKTESQAKMPGIEQSSSEEVEGEQGKNHSSWAVDRELMADCEKGSAAKTGAIPEEGKKLLDVAVDLDKISQQNKESSPPDFVKQADVSVEESCVEAKTIDDNVTSCSNKTQINKDNISPSNHVKTTNDNVSEKRIICDNIATDSNAAKLTSDSITSHFIETTGNDDGTSNQSVVNATDQNTCTSSVASEPKANDSKDILDPVTSPEVPQLSIEVDKDSAEVESFIQKEPVANKSLEDVSDEEMTHQDKEEVSAVDDVVILREDASTTVIAKIDLTLEESTGSDAEEKSCKSGTADATQANVTEKEVSKSSLEPESDKRLLMTDAGFEIDMEVIDVRVDEDTEEKVIYSRRASKRSRETSKTSREPSQGASGVRAPNRDSGKNNEIPTLSPRHDSKGRKHQAYLRSGPYRLVPSRESTAERRDSYNQYERRRSRSPTSYRDANWYRDAPAPQRQNFYPPASDRSQYPPSRPTYTYRPQHTAPEQQWKPTYETPAPTHYPDLNRPPSYSRAPAPEPDRRSGYQYQQQPQPQRDGNRGGRSEASPPWRGVHHSRGRDFQMPHSHHDKRRASPPPTQHRSRSKSLSDMSVESNYGEPPTKKSNKRVVTGGVSSSARNRKVSRSPISISSRSRSLSPVSGSPSPDRNLLRNEIVKSVKQFLHVAREIQHVKGAQKSSHSGSPPARRVSSSKRSPHQKVFGSPRRHVIHSSSRPSPPPAQSHRLKSRSPPIQLFHKHRSPAHQNWGASSRKHSRSPKRVHKSSYKHRSPSPVSSESSPGSPPPPPSMRNKEFRKEPSSGFRGVATLASSSRQSYGTSSRSKRSRELMPEIVSHRSGGQRGRSMEKKVSHSRPTWSEQQREKMASAEAQLKQQSEVLQPTSTMPPFPYLHSGGPPYPYNSPYPSATSAAHQGYNAYSSGLQQPINTGGPYQHQYNSTGYQQPYIAPGTYGPTPTDTPQVAEAYQQAFSILKTALGELQHQPQQQPQHTYPSHSYPRHLSPPHASTSSQSVPSARAQTKSWSMGSNAMVFQRVLGNEGLSRKESGTIELLGDRGRAERPKVAKEIRVLTSVPTKKR